MSILSPGMGHGEHIFRVQRELKGLHGGCTVETLVSLCPDLTWNQIFLAIDELSRSGQIRLRRGSGRSYFVAPITLKDSQGTIRRPAMGSKRIKDKAESTAASCVHGRVIDDVVEKHQTGQVRCLECGTIFDDPHRHKKSSSDNATEQREVGHAVAEAADYLHEKDDAYSNGVGRMRVEEEGLSDALLRRDHSSSY